MRNEKKTGKNYSQRLPSSKLFELEINCEVNSLYYKIYKEQTEDIQCTGGDQFSATNEGRVM